MKNQPGCNAIHTQTHAPRTHHAPRTSHLAPRTSVNIQWSTTPRTVIVTETPDFSQGTTEDLTLELTPVGGTPFDNELKIRNAIDAVNANALLTGYPGTVILPAGEYYTTGIFLKEGVQIIGTGTGTGMNGTTLRRHPSASQNEPMFQCWRQDGNIQYRTYLANSGFGVGMNSDENSLPIEITNLRIDGDQPLPPLGNINGTNEHGAGIELDVPTSCPDPGNGAQFYLRYKGNALPGDPLFTANSPYYAMAPVD